MERYDADINYESSARYVAAVHLPTAVAEQLLSSATTDKVTVEFGFGGKGELCVGEEVYSFSSQLETDFDAFVEEPSYSSASSSNGTLRLIGGVRERLM
jgi:hypothetical protein